MVSTIIETNQNIMTTKVPNAQMHGLQETVGQKKQATIEIHHGLVNKSSSIKLGKSCHSLVI